MDIFFSTKNLHDIIKLGPRKFLKQCINASYAVMGTYMTWKLISLFLNNDSPIVVVLTESMSPGFERGDILWLKPKQYTTGDMTVFQLYKNTIPIVHRAIKQFGNKVLTKGDNNKVDDVSLYRPNQFYLLPEDIKSCVVAYIPFFGMLTIWINTIPAVKFLVMTLIGLNVLITRE